MLVVVVEKKMRNVIIRFVRFGMGVMIGIGSSRVVVSILRGIG